MKRKHPNPNESVERILERLTLLLRNKKPRLSQSEVIQEIQNNIEMLYSDLEDETYQLEDMKNLLDSVMTTIENIGYDEQQARKRKPSR